MTRLLSLLIPLIAMPHATPQKGPFPWKEGDAPPAVGGVHLAATRAGLDSVLGAASDSQDLTAGTWLLQFRKKGMSVVYMRPYGAFEIHLMRRDAGDIGGVRLDDLRASVRNRWGAPSTSELITIGEGATYTWGEETTYIAGKWMVAVTFDTLTTRVTQLWLGHPSDRD
jgi:hypothetical protein